MNWRTDFQCKTLPNFNCSKPTHPSWTTKTISINWPLGSHFGTVRHLYRALRQLWKTCRWTPAKGQSSQKTQWSPARVEVKRISIWHLAWNLWKKELRSIIQRVKLEVAQILLVHRATMENSWPRLCGRICWRVRLRRQLWIIHVWWSISMRSKRAVPPTMQIHYWGIHRVRRNQSLVKIQINNSSLLRNKVMPPKFKRIMNQRRKLLVRLHRYIHSFRLSHSLLRKKSRWLRIKSQNRYHVFRKRCSFYRIITTHSRRKKVWKEGQLLLWKLAVHLLRQHLNLIVCNSRSLRNGIKNQRVRPGLPINARYADGPLVLNCRRKMTHLSSLMMVR